MPEDGLRSYIKEELDHAFDTLDPLDIVRLQQEFSVSFSALVWRLYKTGIIKVRHKERLFKEQESLKSNVLFDMLGIKKDLLVPYGQIQVAQKYVDFIHSNYKDVIILFSSFEKAMGLIGVSKDKIESLKQDRVEKEHM